MRMLGKALLLLCCMGVPAAEVLAKRPAARPMTETPDGGKRQMTPREVERERRRQRNYAKFSSHKPPRKRNGLVSRASWTLGKMLVGAGLGIGALLLIQNPEVAKAIWTTAATWIGSWTK